MEKFDKTMICKSCNKQLKKDYKLCYQCLTSPNKARCTHIKRGNGEQCRLETVRGKCIFHINES